MQVKKAIALSLLLGTLLGRAAWALPEGADPDSNITEAYTDQSVGGQGDARTYSNDMEGSDVFLGNDTYAVGKEFKTLKPSSSTNTITYKGPLAGMRSTMGTASASNTLHGLLTSPLAVTNMVWALTEPGIAMGMQGATNQALLIGLGGILAEGDVRQQLEQQPENKEVMLASLADCASRGANDEEWPETLRRCSGDEQTTGTTIPQMGLGFANDPSDPTAEDTKTYLSSIIFNPELEAAEGDLEAEKYVQDMKDVFENVIGDIEYELNLAGVAMITTATPVPANIGISMFRRIYRENIYNKIFEVMLAKHNYSGAPKATDNCRNKTTKEEAAQCLAGQRFVYDAKTQRLLSTKSFVMDEQWLTVLQTLLQDGITAAELNQVTPDSFVYDYRKIAPKPNGEPMVTGKPLGQNQRDFYLLAQRIADSKILEAIIELDRFLKGKTRAAGVGGKYAKAAEDLIAQAVGGNDKYIDALAKNEEGLKRLLRQILDHSKAKSGGSMLTAPHKPGQSPVGFGN